MWPPWEWAICSTIASPSPLPTRLPREREVAAVEAIKHVLQIFRTEPFTAIAHFNALPAPLLQQLHLDRGVIGAVAQRVIQQIQ